jgi:hypothetical protein
LIYLNIFGLRRIRNDRCGWPAAVISPRRRVLGALPMLAPRLRIMACYGAANDNERHKAARFILPSCGNF